jgi:site-specific DNA-methyltransferase (adenine-specific)
MLGDAFGQQSLASLSRTKRETPCRKVRNLENVTGHRSVTCHTRQTVNFEGDFVTKMALQDSRKKKRPGPKRKYKTNADRQRAYRKRLKRSVHFRSDSDLWSTPQDFFDALHAEFGFTLDVAAIADNAKCDRYFTPEQDGLQQDWGQDICWNNPPYSQVAQWMAKSYEASKAGATVVCLVYAKTDTQWWHDYVEPYADYQLLKGRLKFGGSPNSAPFGSAVVIFWPPIGI